MISLGHYLHNATKVGSSPSVAYQQLTNEFQRGNISYPRSNGKNHHPISIINPSKTHKLVKKIIEYKDKFLSMGKSFLKNASIYLLAEKLNLSSSASLVEDVELAKQSSIEENEDIYFMLKQEKARIVEKQKINETIFEKTLSNIFNTKNARKFDDRNRN